MKCAGAADFARYHANPEAAALKVKARTEEQNAAYRESARKWKQRNKDKQREAYREWVANNPERRKETTAEWKTANKSRVNDRAREWGRANRHKTNAWSMASHAAKMNRTPAWSDLKAIEEVYRDASEFRQSGIEVDVDHVIPLQGELVSGLHVPGNLRVCLSSVNRSKSNQFHIHV